MPERTNVCALRAILACLRAIPAPARAWAAAEGSFGAALHAALDDPALEDAFFGRFFARCRGFRDGEQMDAVEALEAIQAELARETGAPGVFASRVRTTIACRCGAASERDDATGVVRVAVTGACVEDGLQTAFDPQPLDGFRCEACGRRSDATMRQSVVEGAAVLVVQALRFTASGKVGRSWRLRGQSLCLRTHVRDEVYVPMAGIAHLGERGDQGHYLAHVADGSTWWTVDAGQRLETAAGALDDAYVLFLRRL